MRAAAVSDYRELARRRLPRFLFEYIDGGSFGEVTLRRNLADLEAVALRQRVLRDVSVLDLSTELFGQRLAMPVALAPVGLAGMNARRGEVQAARAAEAAGIPLCLSTVAACSLAEIMRAVKQPLWFQLYMVRDRAFMRDMLARAARALQRARCLRSICRYRARAIATYARACPIPRRAWGGCDAWDRFCVGHAGHGMSASAVGRITLGNLEAALRATRC